MGLYLRCCLPGARHNRGSGHAACRHLGHERPPCRNRKDSRARRPCRARDAGWHGSSALRIPDNITIVTLPPYAPELNPVENIWAYLRANRLAISVFDTYDNIVDRCCDAWNAFANDPERVRSIATREYAKAVNG
jgi:hypothetical protein